jgi:hypothetical protein
MLKGLPKSKVRKPPKMAYFHGKLGSSFFLPALAARIRVKFKPVTS